MISFFGFLRDCLWIYMIFILAPFFSWWGGEKGGAKGGGGVIVSFWEYV